MSSQEKRNETGRYYVTICLLCIAAGLIYHFFVCHRACVEIEATTDKPTIFKIYWTKTPGKWSEKRVGKINIYPGVTQYSFWVGNISNIRQLRIDTSERPATVSLHSISIRQNKVETFALQSRQDFQQISPVAGVRTFTLNEKGITVIPEGRDPQLLLAVPLLKRLPGSIAAEAAVICCLFLFIWFVALLARNLAASNQYVVFFMVFVLALIVVMASLSKPNRHPDEFVHVQAGKYYYDHWTPPAIGSPEIRHTYSPYGVSRLHSGEIVYLFAGKFGAILEKFHLNNWLSLRTFNVALFFLLVFIAVNRVEFRVMLIPLLISPQIWYVFSYFNSDAFALFISLLTAYQLAADNSLFNTSVRSDRLDWKNALSLAACGLLLALLLLLKKNFYFFYIFVFLYFLWMLFFNKLPRGWSLYGRIMVIALVGLSTFAAVRYIDNRVNDFKKSEKLLEAREEFAIPMFKPGTPIEKKHIYHQMKAHGVSLEHFLLLDRWGEKSFRTSFGVYGYTSISASFAYYDIVRVVGLGMLAVFTGSILWRGKGEGVSLLLITAVSSAALLAAAMYHAWTVDFQAQGRYFLPIVSMLSVLLYHNRKHLVYPLFYCFLLGLYFLSLYNFIFIGLTGIEKYSFGCI